MKLGIVCQGYVRKDSDEKTRLREVIREAQAADRVGLDSYGVSEQHFKFPTNSTAALDQILGWIAATTEQIRIRPSAVIPALHHPLSVAENWATIDILSGGRVDFAVGRGNTPKTSDAFEIPIPQTNPRTLEALDIIIRAWRGNEFAYHGEFFNFDPVRVTPAPVQSPHPSLSLAAVSVGAATLAGEKQLGYLGATNNLEWHQIDNRINAYRNAWRTGQTIADAQPNSEITMVVPMHLAASMQQARDEAEFGIIEYTNRAMKQDILNHQRTYGNAKGMDTTGQFYDNFDGLLELTALCVGTPDYAIEKILKLADRGVDELSFHLDYATHDQLLECIRLLGEEVAPAVRQEMASRKKATMVEPAAAP